MTKDTRMFIFALLKKEGTFFSVRSTCYLPNDFK